MSLRCAPPNVAYDFIAHPVHRLEVLPFSVERPLLFHVMTGLNTGARGEEELMWMVERGVELAPIVWSPERRSMVMPRDRAAGDGEYLFLTPLTTFSFATAIINKPVLAFDAISLWQASENGFAFRVRDLEPVYASVEPTEVDFDFPEGVNEEELSDDERLDYYNEARADAARDDLRCLANAGTIWDKNDALDMLSIYTMFVFGMLSRKEAYAAARTLIPDQRLEDQGDWCPVAAEKFPDGLSEHWETLLYHDGTSVDDAAFHLFHLQAGRRPEILYKDRIPLCCAALYRNQDGEWARLPADVCRAGARYLRQIRR